MRTEIHRAGFCCTRKADPRLRRTSNPPCDPTKCTVIGRLAWFDCVCTRRGTHYIFIQFSPPPPHQGVSARQVHMLMLALGPIDEGFYHSLGMTGVRFCYETAVGRVQGEFCRLSVHVLGLSVCNIRLLIYRIPPEWGKAKPWPLRHVEKKLRSGKI